MNRSVRQGRFAAAGAAAFASLSVLASAQPVAEGDIAAVLTGVAAYVEQFDRELAGVVLEEQYDQRVLPGSMASRRSASYGRRLRSNLLMVRLADEDRWVQFRDVFEVDGRAVRDRNERLAGLFLSPSASALDQAEQIALESARYNGGIRLPHHQRTGAGDGLLQPPESPPLDVQPRRRGEYEGIDGTGERSGHLGDPLRGNAAQHAHPRRSRCRSARQRSRVD